MTKQHADAFLQFLTAEQRLSPNTLAAYRNDLRQFEEYLRSRAIGPFGDGDGDAATASRDAVAGFFLSLREDKGYSAATIARKMAAVKALFQFLMKQGTIAANPAAELGAPEVKKPLPKAITVDEVDRLMRQTDRKGSPEGLRDRAMLHLLYATGMRVTELVSLDGTDLDTEANAIRCVGRGARVRHLPIDARTVAALRDYLERGRPLLIRPGFPQTALFLNHRGQRLTRQGFWLIMKAVARDSGVSSEVTPHTLRHSFAAHRLSDGLALPRLRELLGHANISTPQVYAQIKGDGPRPLIANTRRLALAAAAGRN